MEKRMMIGLTSAAITAVLSGILALPSSQIPGGSIALGVVCALLAIAWRPK